MSLGSSVTFKEVLKSIVGSESLSARGLLEFYRPLYDWLVEQNQATDNEVGWNKSESECFSKTILACNNNAFFYCRMPMKNKTRWIDCCVCVLY